MLLHKLHDRNRALAAGLLAAVTLTAAAGCEEEPAGAYREFSQLDEEGIEEARGADGSSPERPVAETGQGGGSPTAARDPERSSPGGDDSPGEQPKSGGATARSAAGMETDSANDQRPARQESGDQSQAAPPGGTETASNRLRSGSNEPVIDPETGERIRPTQARSADRTAGPEETEGERRRPREVKVLVKDRDFRTVGPEGALRVSYDDLDLLKVLNMEPVTPEAPELMPGWLRNLDGKRIRIRGFMYPPFRETGIEQFLLARDNQICCFGRNPKIYDVFPVKLRDGRTTDYIQNRPFDVVGVFHIRPEVVDGELHQLYMITDAVVID